MGSPQPHGEPFVRPRRTFQPSYRATYASGALTEKVDRAQAALASCRVCPRDCDVNRLEDEIGVCRTGRFAEVASAFPHFGEEDCLTGWRGSGTIFFSWCNLKCVFCQNSDISWSGEGERTTPERLADLMLALQDRGCHNINFVTPEHVVPQVLEGICAATSRGLKIPIVYNTSAYDSLESIELLDGVVDIYMPDFKFWDRATAKWLIMAEDYPERAQEAIRAMHTQVGDLVFDEDGLALRGLLVRHLVMPDRLAGTRQVMRFLAQEISTDTYINILGQYRPAGRVVAQPERYSVIDRGVTTSEYREALDIARQEGLHRFDRPGHRRAMFH
jgi:putative pyruvate formate lyase activating enzyme